MSAFFVTATGTDIGKTFITAGLIRHLREAGATVSALKPVVSGFDLATAAVSDPGVLLAALEQPITPEAIARISPWRFAAPLSPDMAAALEGRRIDFDELVAHGRAAIADAQGTLFIEGVGGVMVPLDASHTVLDWMAALRLPLILVAGSYLGTISHTLTAIEALSKRDLNIAALAVNESVSAIPLADSIASIRRFAPHVPIGAIGRVGRPFDARQDMARLWNLIDQVG
jgi:dethiobiotin synthetase